METMVDWNQSLFHNIYANGVKNARFPLISSMKDGEKILCSQFPATGFQIEVNKTKNWY